MTGRSVGGYGWLNAGFSLCYHFIRQALRTGYRVRAGLPGRSRPSVTFPIGGRGVVGRRQDGSGKTPAISIAGTSCDDYQPDGSRGIRQIKFWRG